MVDETASYAFNLDTVWTTKGEIQKLKECAMSNEMIERVARALCEGNYNKPDEKLDFQKTGHNLMWQLYIKDARAAISAMREPTEEMLDAGAYDLGMRLKRQWEKMIDAALKE